MVVVKLMRPHACWREDGVTKSRESQTTRQSFCSPLEISGVDQSLLQAPATIHPDTTSLAHSLMDSNFSNTMMLRTSRECSKKIQISVRFSLSQSRAKEELSCQSMATSNRCANYVPNITCFWRRTKFSPASVAPERCGLLTTKISDQT